MFKWNNKNTTESISEVKMNEAKKTAAKNLLEWGIAFLDKFLQEPMADTQQTVENLIPGACSDLKGQINRAVVMWQGLDDDIRRDLAVDWENFLKSKSRATLSLMVAIRQAIGNKLGEVEQDFHPRYIDDATTTQTEQERAWENQVAGFEGWVKWLKSTDDGYVFKVAREMSSELDNVLALLKQRLSDAKGRVATFNQMKADAAALPQVRSELGHVQLTVAGFKQRAETAEDQVQTLTGDVDRLSSQMVQDAERLEKALQESSASQQALQRAQEGNTGLTQQLQDAIQRAETAENSGRELSRQLDEVRAQANLLSETLNAMAKQLPGESLPTTLSDQATVAVEHPDALPAAKTPSDVITDVPPPPEQVFTSEPEPPPEVTEV